jgi:hypothetical protein
MPDAEGCNGQSEDGCQEASLDSEAEKAANPIAGLSEI